jgi:ribosomal-protein-serine acetyltransferase
MVVKELTTTDAKGFFMMPGLFLNDGSIAIRPFRPGDAQPVYDAIQESLADVTPWLRDLGSVRSAADVEAFIALQSENWGKGSAYNFAITELDRSTILGGCGLTQVNQNHRFANLFYWIRSSRTRQGIASRVARMLARYGLVTLGLQRIEIVVETANIASLRVAEKAGAQREGVLRNGLNSHGVPRDAVMFSLTPQDFGS